MQPTIPQIDYGSIVLHAFPSFIQAPILIVKDHPEMLFYGLLFIFALIQLGRLFSYLRRQMR